MNPLLGDNVVGDEFALPCNFSNISEDNVSDVCSLRGNLELNLDQVARDDCFSFDSRYNEDETQIMQRGFGESDKNYFLIKSDILSNAFQQFEPQNGLCYIPNPNHNITYISEPCIDKCNISNLEISTHNDVKCTELSSTEGEPVVSIPESVDSKCFISMGDANAADEDKDGFVYISAGSELAQTPLPCTVNDNGCSLTKTLRNIKRLPPPASNISDAPNTIYNSAQSFKPNYEVLSCTVLIDTSRKNDVEINGSVESCCTSEKVISNNSFPSPVTRMFECLECGKQFREKSHLVTHSRAHTDVRRFKCSKCDLSFKTEINLRFHLNSHNDEPLSCPHCDKKFPARRVLSRHIRIVHSVETFECEQCGKKFKTQKNLIHHYGIHSGVRPFSCKICSKTFLHNSSLNTHMREHSLQNHCAECNTPSEPTSVKLESRISTESLLQDSIPDQSVNMENQEKLKSRCRCGSLCTGTCNGLKPVNCNSICQHVCKPFVCSTCGIPFKLKSALITHMKIHSPSIDYRCEECSKVFVKKVSFEIHMKQHRGERPEFMCDQCSQSYHTQFSLKRHYLKHTTHKSFQCQICEKKFWMKDALQVHLRSHSKERNFKCNFCEKCFSHKSSLVTHIQRIHHNQQAVSNIPNKSIANHR